MHSIEKVTLGGLTQWISLRAAKLENPILLFLHGGPGTAQIAFSRKAQAKLEKDFLVVNWDQRGAGRSFGRKIDREDMKIERFVHDAEELAELLLRRFHQEKLFLIGHSWGSIIGAKLAAKRPDLLWAYVGIGQVVNCMEGETLSYQFTLEEAGRAANKKAIRELERIGVPPYRAMKDAGIQRKWLAKFGGAVANGTVFGMIFANLTLRDIGFLGITKFMCGVIFSLKSLEDELNGVNLFDEISEIKVPVFFCNGRRDYNTPFALAEQYLEYLQSPRKEMVWFENSAHSPNFEEPDAFQEFCLRRVLGIKR